MSRQYINVQELLPRVLAMEDEGCTLREITNHFSLAKEQIKELCKRERRREKKIKQGYLSQPKGRPRKAPAAHNWLQNNRIIELEMKVELLQNSPSESERIREQNIELWSVSKTNIRPDNVQNF